MLVMRDWQEKIALMTWIRYQRLSYSRNLLISAEVRQIRLEGKSSVQCHKLQLSSHRIQPVWCWKIIWSMGVRRVVEKEACSESMKLRLPCVAAIIYPLAVLVGIKDTKQSIRAHNGFCRWTKQNRVKWDKQILILPKAVCLAPMVMFRLRHKAQLVVTVASSNCLIWSTKWANVSLTRTMKNYTKRSIIPTIPRPSKLLAEIFSSEEIARTE